MCSLRASPWALLCAVRPSEIKFTSTHAPARSSHLTAHARAHAHRYASCARHPQTRGPQLAQLRTRKASASMTEADACTYAATCPSRTCTTRRSTCERAPPKGWRRPPPVRSAEVYDHGLFDVQRAISIPSGMGRRPKTFGIAICLCTRRGHPRLRLR